MRKFAHVMVAVIGLTGVSGANAQEVRQLSGAGVAGTEDLPPRYTVMFTQEQFAAFLVDPQQALAKLGYEAAHMTVTVRDSVWMPKDRKWESAAVLRDLPPASSWTWLCGYEDEMCVCYPVLEL